MPQSDSRDSKSDREGNDASPRVKSKLPPPAAWASDNQAERESSERVATEIVEVKRSVTQIEEQRPGPSTRGRGQYLGTRRARSL